MNINIDGVDRIMTADEIAAHQIVLANSLDDRQNEMQQAAIALDSRKEPLRRLGLTEDEINTVLGL